MRIAMVDPSLVAAPYDHHLCQALEQRGHQVTLFSRLVRPDESPLTGSYELVDLFRRFSDDAWVQRLPRSLRVLFQGGEYTTDMGRLWLRLRRWAPAIIHLQWFPFPLLDQASALALRRVAPVVLTVHDCRSFLNPGVSAPLLGWRAMLRSYDGIIVHLEASRRELVEAGVRPERVRVIHHGVLSCQASPPECRERIEVPEPKPPGEKKILCFGALRHYKGVDVLLQAFALLPPELKNKTRLAVVGEPHGIDLDLRELASRLGIAARVDWDLRHVPEDELEAVFQSSDILVFPYRRIDASGVLMLALPFGKPIVATKVGCFAEQLSHEENALLAPSEDPAALAHQLERLLTDGQLACRLGTAAAQLASSLYSWEEIARATEEIYGDVLVGNGSRAGSVFPLPRWRS